MRLFRRKLFFILCFRFDCHLGSFNVVGVICSLLHESEIKRTNIVVPDFTESVKTPANCAVLV